MPSPATSGTIQISRSMNTTMQTSAPMSQVNPQSHMGNPSMNRSAMMSGQQGSQSMQLRGGLSHQQAHSGPMSSSHMRGMASMPQRGGMPPGRQLDGQTHGMTVLLKFCSLLISLVRILSRHGRQENASISSRGSRS